MNESKAEAQHEAKKNEAKMSTGSKVSASSFLLHLLVIKAICPIIFHNSTF